MKFNIRSKEWVIVSKSKGELVEGLQEGVMWKCFPGKERSRYREQGTVTVHTEREGHSCKRISRTQSHRSFINLHKKFGFYPQIHKNAIIFLISWKLTITGIICSMKNNLQSGRKFSLLQFFKHLLSTTWWAISDICLINDEFSPFLRILWSSSYYRNVPTVPNQRVF